MNLFYLFNQRESEEARLIFMGNETVSAELNLESGSRNADRMPEVTRLAFDPATTDPDQQWSRIEEQYGKTPYEELMRGYLDRVMPTDQSDFKGSILRDSSLRYVAFYTSLRQHFMSRSEQLKEAFDFSVNEIVDKTKNDLGVLKSGVEGGRKLAGFNDTLPPPEDKNAVKAHFRDYLKALEGRYFNADVNEGIVIPNPAIPLISPPLLAPDVFRGLAYKSKSAEFQTKMNDWVQVRLDWMLKDPRTTSKELEDFRQEITDRYALYSKIEGSTTIISGTDLAALDKVANPPLDAIGRVLDASDDAVIKRLEVMHLLNPKAWKATVGAASNLVVIVALNNGSEQDFIKTANKYQKADDFDDAVNVFNKKLKELSAVGVKETLAFLREFNSEVHSEVLSYETDIKPEGLRVQVSKQLDYLLGGLLTPHWPEDKMLVRFMTASREERNEILSNNAQRDTLFRGIRLATTKYPGVFTTMIGNRTKFVRSTNIEKPSADDRAAQLKALIILGEQSKVIVSKLNQSPLHRGKPFMDEIDNAKVPQRTDATVASVRFNGPNAGRERFRSALDRGGFNARDLAVKGVKLAGLLAVVANVAQSWSETEGADFADRIFETVERSATNHGVLAGVAMAAGAHVVESNPAFLKYPWLSKYDQQALLVTFKLENIAARLGGNGTQEVKRFTHNDAEWRALNHDNMTGSKIKELVQKKAKEVKPGYRPTINRKDLEGIITETSILDGLTRGGRHGRMRFLFYQKFFAQEVKPDVNRMKYICTGTDYVRPTA